MFVARRYAGVHAPVVGPGVKQARVFPRWADFAKRWDPTSLPTTFPLMKNDEILSQITEFCRKADMAESTFGRRAVNDGKLVHRLREGKRITIDTLERIQAYMAASMAGGRAAATRPSGASGKARSAW
ncbi:hypothetical protein BRDID11002_39500 [Bradyrhizobium diazoefficiens]